MNVKTAHQFADHWIEAWNSHDLDTIIYHGVRGTSAKVFHFNAEGKSSRPSLITNRF